MDNGFRLFQRDVGWQQNALRMIHKESSGSSLRCARVAPVGILSLLGSNEIADWGAIGVLRPGSSRCPSFGTVWTYSSRYHRSGEPSRITVRVLMYMGAVGDTAAALGVLRERRVVRNGQNTGPQGVTDGPRWP